MISKKLSLNKVCIILATTILLLSVVMFSVLYILTKEMSVVFCSIFQNYNLVPVLNVYENIVLPVELDGNKVDKKFMKEVVQMLGLEDKLNNMPNNLSGGQQQRVAIARALVSKPAIVLADEPTGNLDSKTSADVLGLLKTTSQKFHQTLVMITHNNEIAQLADRIIRIEDGKIVQ